jgi:hypothetical protein
MGSRMDILLGAQPFAFPFDKGNPLKCSLSVHLFQSNMERILLGLSGHSYAWGEVIGPGDENGTHLPTTNSVIA